jgi:hypothetical protein
MASERMLEEGVALLAENVPEVLAAFVAGLPERPRWVAADQAVHRPGPVVDHLDPACGFRT